MIHISLPPISLQMKQPHHDIEEGVERLKKLDAHENGEKTRQQMAV